MGKIDEKYRDFARKSEFFGYFCGKDNDMIIGRENEIQELKGAFESEYSEFVVVYGRRRVGKTYLIRETFDYTFTFQHSGVANVTKREQIKNFVSSLRKHGMVVKRIPKTWFEVFDLLEEFLEKSPDKKKRIFLDEIPWMDSQKSNFMAVPTPLG